MTEGHKITLKPEIPTMPWVRNAVMVWAMLRVFHHKMEIGFLQEHWEALRGGGPLFPKGHLRSCWSSQPCGQLPTDQQGAAWFVGWFCGVCTAPVWKATVLKEEVTTNQLGGLNSVLFALIFGFLATHRQWPYGQVEKIMENWHIEKMPVWGTALWESLWEFEGCIKLGHIDAHRKNPFQSYKMNGAGEWILGCGH